MPNDVPEPKAKKPAAVGETPAPGRIVWIEANCRAPTWRGSTSSMPTCGPLIYAKWILPAAICAMPICGAQCARGEFSECDALRRQDAGRRSVRGGLPQLRSAANQFRRSIPRRSIPAGALSRRHRRRGVGCKRKPGIGNWRKTGRAIKTPTRTAVRVNRLDGRSLPNEQKKDRRPGRPPMIVTAGGSDARGSISRWH